MMGLMFSSIISYAGVLETIECIKHILSGMVPEGDPDFQELVDHYHKLLHKASEHNPSVSEDWSKLGGQGYLSFTDNEEGRVTSATIKYYDSDSAALLFSTKISSFGQDSVDTTDAHDGYGSKQTERYTTTKTMVSNTSESFSVGQRNKSPTASYENISDPTVISANSFISKDDEEDDDDRSDSKEKLKWHYRPQSPSPSALPEIHFQSYDETGNKDTVYSEDYLRSLDGIKFRPLQRSDPSGRRRSFKKRHSSSSTSSKDSRASREEELKLFTSLEEAEFERIDKDGNAHGFGSTPNLETRSYSRSRSRDNSKERRSNEAWSVEPPSISMDNPMEEADRTSELKPKLSDLPKLGSFEEEDPEDTTEKPNEVNEQEEEEEDDFWGNSGD